MSGGTVSMTIPHEVGLRLELHRSACVTVPYDLFRRGEALGRHSVWTAEAYAVDALTPLAAIADDDPAET